MLEKKYWLRRAVDQAVFARFGVALGRGGLWKGGDAGGDRRDHGERQRPAVIERVSGHRALDLQSGRLYDYAFVMILGLIGLLAKRRAMADTARTRPIAQLPLLSLLIWVPILGGALACSPGNRRPAAGALGSRCSWSLIDFALSIGALHGLRPAARACSSSEGAPVDAGDQERLPASASTASRSR